MADVILKDEEAERQRGLLLGLQVALGDLGIRAVLARDHHLGLPTEYVRVSGVCGQKPPSLHVFAGRLGLLRVHVSDGSFALATGQSFPAEDAGTAAGEIRRLAGLDRTIAARRRARGNSAGPPRRVPASPG
jgi:hypothetical protein